MRTNFDASAAQFRSKPADFGPCLPMSATNIGPKSAELDGKIERPTRGSFSDLVPGNMFRVLSELFRSVDQKANKEGCGFATLASVDPSQSLGTHMRSAARVANMGPKSAGASPEPPATPGLAELEAQCRRRILMRRNRVCGPEQIRCIDMLGHMRPGSRETRWHNLSSKSGLCEVESDQTCRRTPL